MLRLSDLMHQLNRQGHLFISALIYLFMLTVMGSQQAARSECSAPDLKDNQGDQAPSFLFLLQASQAQLKPVGTRSYLLSIPSIALSSVTMLSERAGWISKKFVGQELRNLFRYKTKNLEAVRPNAVLSFGSGPSRIVEILAIDSTPHTLTYRIQPIGLEPDLRPGERQRISLSMDAAAKWGTCSQGNQGYSSPILRASVCRDDLTLKANCPDCQCCP